MSEPTEPLHEHQLHADPFLSFEEWFQTACAAELAEPNAMSLATAAGSDVSVRMVLMKVWDRNGFVFFTNYGSRKAQQIEANPNVGLLFYWEPLHRQIRIEGAISRISAADSLNYFISRPRGSQLGAWCSEQSTVITSRDVLSAKLDEIKRKFANRQVPLPSLWGGYRVVPRRFEFWQQGADRLHDRFLYDKSAKKHGKFIGWHRNHGQALPLATSPHTIYYTTEVYEGAMKMKTIDEPRLESDLAYRFEYLTEFMGFTGDDIAAIHGAAPLLEPVVPALVDAVYEKLFSYDATKRHFVPRQSGYEGQVPENIGDLDVNHEMIQFRKGHLARYLLSLVTRPYDQSMVKYLDFVGRIHTPHAGSADLDVPLVQMNALMGFVSDALVATLLGLDLDEATKVQAIRAFNKLLWLQNDLIGRHYGNAAMTAS